MYRPKLFANASLILSMFAKMAFTSLLLPTLVIIPNLVSLSTCPSKKLKKIVWRYTDWDNRHFFLYIDRTAHISYWQVTNLCFANVECGMLETSW